MAGDIKSEWRATSNRNSGRAHFGMVGDINRNQHAKIGQLTVERDF